MTLITHLCGSEDRYIVPKGWRGRESGPWEMRNEFPAPAAIQAEADLVMFYLSYTGCPSFCVSMECVCFNCTQMQEMYIPYAQQLMEAPILDNIPVPGRKGLRSSFDFVSPNDMSNAIIMVQHL